jgi:hypothetical protein
MFVSVTVFLTVKKTVYNFYDEIDKNPQEGPGWRALFDRTAHRNLPENCSAAFLAFRYKQRYKRRYKRHINNV